MHSSVTIRTGQKQDLPRVLELVKELALYERAPHEVINTVEQMEQDGFGPNPIYGFFVAENENGIVEKHFLILVIKIGVLISRNYFSRHVFINETKRFGSIQFTNKADTAYSIKLQSIQRFYFNEVTVE